VTSTGQSAGDPDYGTWRSIDLTQSASDSTLWTAKITPSDSTQAGDLHFMLQAVNGVGVVAVDNNGGQLYAPGTMPGFTSSTATATNLALTLNGSAGTAGGSEGVSAVLTNAQGAPLSGKQVSFSLGNVTVSAATDSTGTAQTSLPLLAGPGPTTVAAAFAGDTDDLPSAAPAHSFTINPPATSLSISPADGANPDVVDGSATGVTATLTSSGQPLAGKPVAFVVTNSHGAVVSSTLQTTDGNGVARMGAISVAPGSNTVTATFNTSGVVVAGVPVTASDTGYQGSSATTHLHGIEPTQTSISADNSSPTYGASVTLTATVVPAGGAGTVKFAAGSTTITGCGQQPLTVGAHDDVATCTISSWSAGSYQTTAAFSGATDYQASTSTPLAVTLSQAPTTTTLSAPATSTWGGSIQLTATVAPTGTAGAAMPSGTVTFYDGNVAIGAPVPVAANGTATVSLPRQGSPTPGAGDHTWQAAYSGDGNYVSSQRTASTVIAQASTKTVVTTTPATFGQPAVIKATVTPTDAGGQLAFYLDGSSSATCTVPVVVAGSAGTGSCSVNGLAVGKHTVSVTFAHDNNLLNSTGSGTVQVGQAATVTTLSAPTSARFGTTVSLTASVAPACSGAGKPTGSVTFTSGSQVLGTAVLTTHASGPSTATVTVTGLLGGGNAFKATYAGDSSYTGSSGTAATSVTF
jgi:hypothetical protein